MESHVPPIVSNCEIYLLKSINILLGQPVHIGFPGKNKKVACTTYNFLQKLTQLLKEFKMADLDIMQSQKRQNIVYCLIEVLK